MESYPNLYSIRREWPLSLNDVADAPSDTEVLRVEAKCKNFNRLPELQHLRRIHCSRITKDKLSVLSQCTSLEEVYLDNLSTDTLAPFQNLRSLRLLNIESWHDAESLESLAMFHSLSALGVTNCKNIHSIKTIKELVGLNALIVSGSIWTRMDIDTLAPLSDLTYLRYLDLTNLKVADESLRPLEHLTALEQLEIANFYPMHEFARLSQALPKTRCRWLKPYTDYTTIPCRSCDKPRLVMPSGKGTRIMCQDCDRKRLDKHLEKWAKAIAS